MDETDFSEDTTSKQQEDLPYDDTCPQVQMCDDGDFTSKNKVLGVADQVVLTEEELQAKAAHSETCPDTAAATTWGRITENDFVVDKNCDKEKQYPLTLYIPADKGDTSKSKISDILLHHLSKEQFLGGQGIDCETLPEISNADSTDEAAIVTNISSCYVRNFWPKEQSPEFTDQLNPNRDGENSSKPSHSPGFSDLEELVTVGKSSHQENSNLLIQITDLGDKQKSCKGHESQKQLTEKASSSSVCKYGQGQVHYQPPDFSKVAPEVKIPKHNLLNKSPTVAKQASFSPKLRNKSIIVQDILENLSRSNSVEEQQAERQGNSAEPSQHAQMESPVHIQELLTGLEPEPSLLTLTSASQKDLSTSSSSIFQKICQGKQMYQKLKEQTDQLKTKVQEFSKRLQQDTLCHLQDKKLVLEQLQGHLEELQQEFVATKEKHLALLQQHIHRQEAPAAGDFDLERTVEGKIFKLEMLLEDMKEKTDERKCPSVLSLPMNSPAFPEDTASAFSSSSDEVDPSGASGSPEPAATVAPSPGCAFCRCLLEWKQKMERKGLRRINCGKFSIIIHEKALHQDPTLGLSCSGCSSTRGHCGAEVQSSPGVRGKDPLQEFHYRYDTPGQYYLNHSRRGAFVQPGSLDENKTSAPSFSKLKQLCSHGVNSQSFEDECEPALGKNPKTCTARSAEPAVLRPRLQACRISGSKSLCDFSAIEKTESKILNSALDHALKTATILKKTTDQMIRAIAEDLAKAKRWRNRLKY
ncbi:protein AKNAD1 [Octodon degus]|uniref:Protein AKNAD1 n=1 Tax=Octodon degus TaxID=10160 RepID=A0A6P3FG72_OCTDE|nr:protein AKNAD1 [Octodon degus]